MFQSSRFSGSGGRLSTMVVAIVFSAAASANAVFIEEYFNGYGTTDAALSTKGAAGGGWSGGWGGAGPNYEAGSQLTYSGSGYTNTGNDSTASDGRADYGSGNTESIATRTFASGMTGTIWLSWLASDQGNATYATELSFDGSTANYFRILDGQTGNRQGNYNSVAVTPTLVQMPGAYTPGTTGLLLSKIDMDYSGSLDRVTMWLNPDLSGGMSTIGSGFILGDSADVFGSTFDSVSVSFSRNNGAIDSIRISNDADGFFDVTGFIPPVPEPSSFVLLGLGIPVLLRRRRRTVRLQQTDR